MIPVVTVFIDGLNPESLDYMPFLKSLKEQRRIKTDFGYSTTCHASMYTGVTPNKHHIWFIWQYSPKTSPFSWINKSALDRLPNNVYSNYAIYRASRLFARDISSFFGIPFLWNLPMRMWHYYDVAEKKLWTKPQYSEFCPTIFEILKQKNVDYDIIGLPANHAQSYKMLSNHNKEIREFIPSHIKPWTYLFIGDIDPLSHWYGQDSPRVREVLKEIDELLAKKYEMFSRQLGDFAFFLYSDHGHTRVTNQVDLYDVFSSCGKDLNNYMYFLDATFARFWFRNATERQEVQEVLFRLSDQGFILTEELQEKYAVNMPDNRFGDLIFYLDTPSVFDKGEVSAFGKKRNPPLLSAHGYSPDHTTSDGLLVSNKSIKAQQYVTLQDILPSIFKKLDVPIPQYVDGHSFWL